jgi:RimJ/RimL family protein N-acetyltransferase
MPNEASAPTLPATVELRDGRQVTLRAIREQDKAGMLAAFHRLSPDARYTRFMMSMREPPAAMLEAALHPVPGREFAVVAVSGEGAAERIVGSARYVAGPGRDTCEFGVTLADDWHGAGLARRLLALLIDTARARGFRCIEGYVLTLNAPMRRLARRLGFVDRPSEDDPMLREIRLELAAGGCAARWPQSPS